MKNNTGPEGIKAILLGESGVEKTNLINVAREMHLMIIAIQPIIIHLLKSILRLIIKNIY